jgi:hypothetical protein
MATLNTIYYLNSGKQLYVNNDTNQFVISGYQLSLDPNLNANISLVNPPNLPDSLGQKGTITFDKNHVYYCYADNNWSRARLAGWTVDSTVSPIGITNPNNWWYFTLNSDPVFGNDYFFSNGNVTFNSSGVNTSGTNNNGLFCYKTLAIPGWSKAMMYYGQPEGLYPNRFSTSFETKRVNSSGFLLGSKYGQLNFHFEFSGNYLVFNMPKSAGGGNPVTGQWHKIPSISQFNNSSYYQVVATFDPRNDSLAKFYVNGVLQGSANYHYTTVSLYNGGFSFNTIPQAQGFGIGGTPLGNINGAQPNTLTENNKVIVRNLGFWYEYALNQTEITALYNGGTFRKYPFA